MDQQTGEPGERPAQPPERFDAFGTFDGSAGPGGGAAAAGGGVGGGVTVPGGGAVVPPGGVPGEFSSEVPGGVLPGSGGDNPVGRVVPVDGYGGFRGPGRHGGGGDASQEFDAFGARAAQPAPGPLVPLTPARAIGPAVPRDLPALPAVPHEDTSLFDSTMPLPKMTAPPPRDPLAAEIGTPSGGSTRVRRVLAGDFLLTVNPVDGTEVTPCPPEDRPTPVRRTAEDRAARIVAARPAPPPGPPATELPLLERDEDKERLIRLLARGRSIRVTGPSGAGRTALLESVARACGDLAPDGVLWLSGYRRTAADLLQDLYATVYAGDGYRPGRAELPGLLREIGAVVVLDDLEFGGPALEDLLATAPECAFLMSATPDVPVPAPDSMVDEAFLSGLTRVACLDLLQFVTGRRLEEDETAWAADLWFESEGLPLRFVQAGALLRQRDGLRQPPEPDGDDSVWEKGAAGAPGVLVPGVPGAVSGLPGGPVPVEIPDLTGFDEPVSGTAGPVGSGSLGSGSLGSGTDAGADAAGPPGGGTGKPVPEPSSATGEPAAPPHRPRTAIPLPSLAESAAPAGLLASRLGESAREALAFAVALDGECPHASHLPALVGDTHGDAALGELTSVGLAVPVSSHFRLAVGVVQQVSVTLAEDGELSDVQAHTAALHYAWWTGHPSVTPERATAESEAILAALTACRDGGHPSAAVLLARTVAPAFAAALHWGAWERALRVGQEAARLAGEVAEEAYFHHELGVLALCTGNTDRARAELEASIALRGALADRQGTIVGRRTLALVNDRAGGLPPELLPAPPAPAETTLALPAPQLTVISKRPPADHAPHGAGGTSGAHSHRSKVFSRRKLVVAGTGALLAGVLGTIVTVGATSDGGGTTPNQVKPIESVQQDAPEDTTVAPEYGTAPPPAPTTATPMSSAPTTTATTPPPPGSTDGPTSRPGVPVTPDGSPEHTTRPPTTPTTPTPAPSTTTQPSNPSTPSRPPWHTPPSPRTSPPPPTTTAPPTTSELTTTPAPAKPSRSAT